MTASVILFKGTKTQEAPEPWTGQDLTEIERIARSLQEAGLSIDCEAGTTDEGDPWYVICDSFTNEILIHYAKIGAKYVSEIICLGLRLEGQTLPKLEQLLEVFSGLR